MLERLFLMDAPLLQNCDSTSYLNTHDSPSSMDTSQTHPQTLTIPLQTTSTHLRSEHPPLGCTLQHLPPQSQDPQPFPQQTPQSHLPPQLLQAISFARLKIKEEAKEILAEFRIPFDIASQYTTPTAINQYIQTLQHRIQLATKDLATNKLSQKKKMNLNKDKKKLAYATHILDLHHKHPQHQDFNQAIKQELCVFLDYYDKIVEGGLAIRAFARDTIWPVREETKQWLQNYLPSILPDDLSDPTLIHHILKNVHIMNPQQQHQDQLERSENIQVRFQEFDDAWQEHYSKQSEL